jgi:ribonuclease HII
VDTYKVDTYEKEAVAGGFTSVAGVDEAGRGPLAGPVVAAAVLYSPSLMGLGIDDSKKLTEARREAAASAIFKHSPTVGVGVVWHGEVDELNIHNASLLAMERAVGALSIDPSHILVDGIFIVPGLKASQEAVKTGDTLSVSIAAASVIAKTTRDSIMVAYHSIYPAYNFLKNKGYGTKEHRRAIAAAGPCPIHRRSFNLLGEA